jgi:hypothetical protein
VSPLARNGCQSWTFSVQMLLPSSSGGQMQFTSKYPSSSSENVYLANRQTGSVSLKIKPIFLVSDPLPLKQRALPQSFWQPPGVICYALPPLPLGSSSGNDDVVAGGGGSGQARDSPNSYQKFIMISLPVSTTCLFSTWQDIPDVL